MKPKLTDDTIQVAKNLNMKYESVAHYTPFNLSGSSSLSLLTPRTTDYVNTSSTSFSLQNYVPTASTCLSYTGFATSSSFCTIDTKYCIDNSEDEFTYEDDELK